VFRSLWQTIEGFQFLILGYLRITRRPSYNRSITFNSSF